MPKFKSSNATIWVVFKQCVLNWKWKVTHNLIWNRGLRSEKSIFGLVFYLFGSSKHDAENLIRRGISKRNWGTFTIFSGEDKGWRCQRNIVEAAQVQITFHFMLKKEDWKNSKRTWVSALLESMQSASGVTVLKIHKKKSHLRLQAKRARFTFWVDKS